MNVTDSMLPDTSGAAKKEWRYILLNGPYKKVSVLNPIFDKGDLKSIDDLRPFDKKDENGIAIKPTLEDANEIKRSQYIEFFKKSFKNLLILTGAGSSLDVGGPLMIQLWSEVQESYKSGNIDGFEIIQKSIGFDTSKRDLEALLSHIEGYIRFANDLKIKVGQDEYLLSSIRDNIFNTIRDRTTIPKPTGQYPHKIFLEKLLQRKQTSPRIKLFTLNYDLLFEYAATDVNAIVIDGFSFTYPRTFSGRLFDYDIVQREGSKLQEEDNFIQRVLHLHKLHGSLNWARYEDKVIVTDKPEKPLLVYPREAKYEDSYDQPFFEMMARFQRSLRANFDTLLICIGYSFNDKHINAAIEEALNQNPSFRLAVINPRFDADHVAYALKQINASAEISERIILISEKFIDFASFFPEIKTYETESYETINLKNDQSKD